MLRGIADHLRPAAAASASGGSATAPSYWAAAAQRQPELPLLDLAKLDVQFSYDAFLRDGVAVLPGVLTPDAQRRCSEAVVETQALNDDFMLSDWSQIDWAALGEPAPPLPPVDTRRGAIGKSQALARSIKAAGGNATAVQLLRRHGVIPEYFPPGHHEFFADAISHPDMLTLMGLLFGDAPFQFDHAQILTRQPGYAGHPWHSHANGDASDDAGTCTDPSQYGSQQRNLIFLFIYPDGVGVGDEDGGLKVSAGSHLFRDAAIDSSATPGVSKIMNYALKQGTLYQKQGILCLFQMMNVVQTPGERVSDEALVHLSATRL